MPKEIETKDLAGKIAEFYLELTRKGIPAEEAIRLSKEIGHAASSSSHGHCAVPEHPMDLVSQPPITRKKTR